MEQENKSSETTEDDVENNKLSRTVTECEEENRKEEFENKVKTILEKLKSLPSTASELKISTLTLDAKEVYSKLCSALKVPINFTLISNVESETLDFSYQCLGPVAIIPAAKALHLFKKIQVLDLKYNRLGPKSLPAITSLLDHNNNITHLNLSSNCIGKGCADTLSKLISQCHSIEFLDLSNNNLGDDELQEICLSLITVDSTKELNLNTNDFGPLKAPVFRQFISKCKSLLKLDLSCCHLEEGATYIFSALKLSNLTSLNLSRNGIPSEAMQVLAVGLKTNKSLQNLDISYNSITNKGAVALVPGFKSSTLEEIRISHNPIQGSGAFALLNAGGNLKLLDLSGIKVNLAFIKTFNSYTKAGKEVKVLFGSDVRYDCIPRNFKIHEDNLEESNVITFLENMADDKGVSLRMVLKSIHAECIKEEHAATATRGKPPKDEPQESPGIATEDFFKKLIACPIAVKKPLALEVAKLLSIKGYVDMWDLLSKIKWKPDDLFVKVKAPPKPKPEAKKKK